MPGHLIPGILILTVLIWIPYFYSKHFGSSTDREQVPFFFYFGLVMSAVIIGLYASVL